MFKKFLIAACLVVSLSLSSFAAFPQQINYQGKLTDSGGVPLTGSYSILFTIWSAPSAGNNYWSETQSVSVEAGFFNVLLGSVTPITTEVFNGSDRWLGIKVGADPEMTPRHKLVSVGNAFYAYNSNKLDGHDWAEVPSVDNVVLLGPTSTQSTNAASAINVESSASTGTAVLGIASATGAGSYANYGGSFQANGDLGYGVFGDSTGSGGKGVGGRSSGANGYGIYGVNTGTGYSGYFTGGKGVRVVGTIESTAGGFKFPDGTIQTTAATGGATGDYVLKTGDTMTGTLTFEGVTYDITTGSNQHLALMPNGSGGVGIGTTTPLAKLHVAGKIQADSTILGTILYLTRNDQDVLMTLYGGGTGVNWTIGNEDTQNGDFIISNANSLSNPKLTVTQGQGRVGIGTTTPTNLLTVMGTIESRNGELYLDQSNIRIYRSDGQDLVIKFIGDNNGIPWAIGQDDSGSGDFGIANENSLSSKRMLTIKESTGRVGIGTTAPTSLLTVTGTIESTIGGIKFPDGTLQTTAATGAAAGNYVEFAPTSAQATVAAYPVWVETSSTAGRAVYGRATSTGGNSTGGYFETASIGGSAVYGEANGTNATAISGSADGANGKAIYGSAGGDGHAGYFDGNLYVNGLATIETYALGGRAVYGRATRPSGTNYGGYFQSESSSGVGVYGYSSGTSGKAIFGEADGGVGAYGGYFEGGLFAADSIRGVTAEATGAGGIAVYGNATATGANRNYGGYFKAAGDIGYGVYASANHGTGIYAYSGGTNGKAVYGETDQGDGAYGGYFEGGLFASGHGYGASVEASSAGGRAVFGNAKATGPTTNYGGFFLAGGDDAHAVHGEAGGSAAHAVHGEASGSAAVAVYGRATHTTGPNYGGRFISDSSNGAGVYATNSDGSSYSSAVQGAITGSGRAIYGINYSSAGYAGYFEGRLRTTGSVEVGSMPNTANPVNVYWDPIGRLLYHVGSSKRYKDNIKPFLTDFNLILKAEPKSYTDKATGDQNIGFIAEEFDEIGLKELVVYDEQGRPDSLNYDRVPIYLLEVIKDQRKEIADLKSRLEAIEAKLE
jgi:hypothetical protein